MFGLDRIGMKRMPPFSAVVSIFIRVIPFEGYWQNLASAASFGVSTSEACLATIHEEITESWNFYDPNDVRALDTSYSFMLISYGSAAQRQRVPGPH
jgi:hypothetical protein